MICHAASGQTAPDKGKEAVQWCLQVAAYVNKKYPSANAQVMQNINGSHEWILYVEMWDSLGAWEQASAAIEADPAWQALAVKYGEMFVPGSVHHNFYRTVK